MGNRQVLRKYKEKSVRDTQEHMIFAVTMRREHKRLIIIGGIGMQMDKLYISAVLA